MSSVLKSAKKLGGKRSDSKPSSSIGALRWTLPDEDIKGHSSAPSRPAQPIISTKHPQQQPHQNGLKDLCSLQECVLFIQHWKEQVDQVCKGGCDPGEGLGNEEPVSAGPRTERSLEESRKLILEWAEELHHEDKLLKKPSLASEGKKKGEEKDEDASQEAQLRIVEWAKEVQKVAESCGVPSEDLGKVLLLHGLKKKRLVSLLPLLEFITWSLLTEDKMKLIPRVWLLAKQRTWKAGIPRYIPNSVWAWIYSEKTDVTLDPLTNHQWLQLSDDQRQVQEGLCESDLPYNSQRFDSWPCVLGWEGYDRGRHFWEVDITNKGHWRIGVTTADSERHGRFPMNPKQNYWVLWRSTHQFYACTQPEEELPVSLVPKRLGVYLDYEEGQISFYNAETKTHIYTFNGTFKEKLYPLFAPLDGRTILTIDSPHKITAL